MSGSDIRDFRDSLRTDIEKGIFITTGTFTTAARKEATNPGKQHIDLIDGEGSINELIECLLGVKGKTVFEVNETFFEGIESETAK